MNKQEMKFWARMFENTPNMSPEVMQGWIDNPKALKKLLSGLVPAETRLTSLTSLGVASNTVNPHDFFQTREGLWTSNNFNDYILSGLSKKKVSVNEMVVGYADLAQSANDAEIGSELPEGYVFEDVDTFLAHLATLIEGQWGGKEGTLLNNGYANIFYVKVNGEVFAVSVDWSADYRWWGCSAYRPGGYRWRAGDRAFSATATQA
ncbi:hypothetical protein KC959_01605 [Candidatus Saccharibacteria bacterium]|nr:hypothetical protein [Candidatus Saccharibacteria bacterium]